MIIKAEKISKSSFFKLLLISVGLGLFFFFLLCGIAALFGSSTVTWNGEVVTGIKGLLAALLMWPFFSLFLVCFLWLFGVLGLWAYSLISPLYVEFKGDAKPL